MISEPEIVYIMTKLFLVLLLIVPFLVCAQTKIGKPYRDSLLAALPKTANDTNRVLLLDELSFYYSQVDPDEGIKYSMQALELATSLNWTKGIAAAYSDLGINYRAKSDHTKAIYYYESSLKLFEEIGSKRSVAAVLSNLSAVYLEQSNYNEALKYAFDALKINEDLNESKNTGAILENIGSIYLELKNYSKTMEYYKSALKSYKNNGNENGVARCIGNIGIVYEKRGDYNNALKYHLKALEAKKKYKDKAGILNTYANIGSVYFHQKLYVKALEYYEMAMYLSEEIGSKSSYATNLGNMGETYFLIAKDEVHTANQQELISGTKEKKLQLAIKYLTDAIAICEDINFNGPLIEFSAYLSKALLLSGDHNKSLEAFEQYTRLKDSIFSQQNMMQLSNLETKRELELKDKDIIIRDKKLEIANLKAANTRKERMILIAGIIILIFVGSLIYMKFSNRIRLQNNVLEDISQLQSHYVRGPVASIMGLMQIYNEHDLTDPINQQVIAHLKTATSELDERIKKIINKTEV